jgi:uncharacterized protein YjiS (DUF1127 family)
MTTQTIILLPDQRLRRLSAYSAVTRGARFAASIALSLVHRWRDAARIRKELAAWQQLSDYQLRDIGVSRSDLWGLAEPLPAALARGLCK